MATPLYKRLKNKGYTTYAFPGAAEDISASHQNEALKLTFSKFVLLNMNLAKMELLNGQEFNTFSLNPVVDKGEQLIASLRNYVANHEVALREAKQTNNSYFYDPTLLATTTERIFWKWLRKTGLMQFEPAVPNDDFIDSSEFGIDENLPEDYFREYLWKERNTSLYDLNYIKNTGVDVLDDDGVLKRQYRLTLSSSSSLKPGDEIILNNTSLVTIGFSGEKQYKIRNVDTKNMADFTGDSTQEFESKNNWLYILSELPLSYNNAAVVTIQLRYNRVVQYIGEIASSANINHENKAYTEVLAFLADYQGQTPDVLFRVKYDKNYSPNLQIPILPFQDQPEIIGGELYDCPLVLNPENYPGDQYAYFDADQKYINSTGLQDRRRGEYFGVMETSRRRERVALAPFTYPEFDGSKLDGLGIDFNTEHYVRMHEKSRTLTFDEFNSKAFNGQAPQDFEYNVILWYYEMHDTRTDTYSTNLYGLTVVNSLNDDGVIPPYPKLVSNGKQDGISYQHSLNLNFTIHNDNAVEVYDAEKTNNLFGFAMYQELMSRMLSTNEEYMNLIGQFTSYQQQLNNVKSHLYNQATVRDLTYRIDSLYKLLDQYKRNQLRDSSSIAVKIDDTQTPPKLFLENISGRFGTINNIPVTTLYNKENNTAIDTKISVPTGNDFMINIINDDATLSSIDRPLNIVFDRDLDYKQACEINIYAKNAKSNKKLTVSINSSLTASDKTTGYNLLQQVIDLPIDNNLNPNVKVNGIPVRWNRIPETMTPSNVYVRKLSDTYYIVIEVQPLLANTFKSGDVILLDNFSLIYADATETITTDISGQYEIVGDIIDSKLVMVVDLESYKTLYEKLHREDGTKNEYQLTLDNFTQPVYFRFNSGYTVNITCISREATSIKDMYLITVNPLQNK